jgi:hypothetical protein
MVTNLPTSQIWDHAANGKLLEGRKSNQVLSLLDALPEGHNWKNKVN